MLLKLDSGRAQDVADVSRMLALADDPTLERVRSVVDAYRPEDRDDMESLLALGRLELE